MLSLNTKPLSEAEFQAVHLAVVSFVVIAREVKQAVEDELGDLVFECQTVVFCLQCGGLDRDRDVAEVCFVFSAGEGEDVGCFIRVSKLLIEFLNALV